MTGDISRGSALPPSLPRNVVYNNIPDCLALTTIDRETLSVPGGGAPLHTATAKGTEGEGDVEERVRETVFVSQPHWLPMLALSSFLLDQ